MNLKNLKSVQGWPRYSHQTPVKSQNFPMSKDHGESASEAADLVGQGLTNCQMQKLVHCGETYEIFQVVSI